MRDSDRAGGAPSTGSPWLANADTESLRGGREGAWLANAETESLREAGRAA